MRTHDDDDTVSTFLQTFGYLIVFFPCHLLIHGEQKPRAIRKFGFLLLKRVGGGFSVSVGKIGKYKAGYTPEVSFRCLHEQVP